MHTPAPTSSAVRRLAPTLLLFPLLGACSTTPEDEGPIEVRQFGPDTRTEASIGKYLADLSNAMTAWMNITLDASNERERSTKWGLETNLRESVRLRQGEILAELEAGPPQNRVIAAAALGFSEDPAVLSPLLAALDDRDPKVVSNALLGLTLLASPETPLPRIGELLRHGEDSKLRWSAANCSRTLIQAGADGSVILDDLRAGLTDLEEPVVRSQCALSLALLEDLDSIEALGGAVYDAVPLVSRAAAQGLVHLGRTVDTCKGEVARILVGALLDGDRELRVRVHRSLRELSGHDYGLDEEEWVKWSERLP